MRSSLTVWVMKRTGGLQASALATYDHHREVMPTLVSIQKREFFFKIEALDKFYRRHIVDIPRTKF
jgi:hypothetical protein